MKIEIIAAALFSFIPFVSYGQVNSTPDLASNASAPTLNNQPRHLYMQFLNSYNMPVIMEVEHATIGNDVNSISDFNDQNIKFISKTSIFGKMDASSLWDIKKFSYKYGRTKDSSITLTTTFNDGRTATDTSFHGYPIKVHSKNNDSEWKDVTSFQGTAYSSFPQSINHNAKVDLHYVSSGVYDIQFVSEEEAEPQIEKIKKIVQDQERNQKQSQAETKRKEQEQQQAEEQQRAKNIAAATKAPRGSEDSCQRTDLNKWAVRVDPKFVIVNCQFGGEISLDDLKNAGWLVVNKSINNDGVVTDYYIRKAR